MRTRLDLCRPILQPACRLIGSLRASRLLRCVILLAGLTLSSSGCATVMVSATNPVPGLTTVAVAPFFNLSAEPAADGRRVALAYFTELQKNPGFQVIPVGVVEQAINDHNLSMSSPADVVELAKVLNVDAVVVGAITEYRPYYPPQIGMQVQWYSPRNWVFYPGIPGSPNCDNMARGANPAPLRSTVRAQSIDDDDSVARVPSPPSSPFNTPREINVRPTQGTGKKNSVAQLPLSWPNTQDRSPGVTSGGSAKKSPVSAEVRKMFSPPGPPGPSGPPGANGAAPPPGEIKPLMTYTRIFHGLDPNLQQQIQGYVIYSGDLRSGGWEAYLQRSEDFLKFAAHQMIVEMLALHGGTLKTETVITCWK